MRIQYKYPQLYQLLIPIIHRKAVLEQFSKEVGSNVGVFDVAAGFGQMARYLDSSNAYYGIDLNRKFVEFGRKKNRDLAVKDIFDPTAYRQSDVFILVDVIHHLPQEKLPELFELIFTHAKQRVVVLEPAFLNLGKKYGPAGAAVDWAFKKLDDDGVNKIDHWLSEGEYETLFKDRFSAASGKQFELRVKKIYPYFLVTFQKAAL